jgi:hypothetical protein
MYSIPIMALMVGVIGDFIEALYFFFKALTYSGIVSSGVPPSNKITVTL